MPPPQTCADSRRGFAASPLVILLLVAFVAMLAWRVLALGNFLSTMFGPQAVDWDRIIWTHILIGLGGTAAAGGIAAGAYFAMGRSERSANVAMGLVLAGGAGWFAYLNVGEVFKFKPNGPQPPSVPYSARSSGPTPSPTPRPTPGLPSPVPGSGPGTTSPPASPLANPSGLSPSGTPGPSQQAPPTATPPAGREPSSQPEGRVQEVTSTFLADTIAACERVANSYESLVKALRNPPERSRAAQDAIVKQIDALDAERKSLADALDRAPADLLARLIDAGVEKDAAAAEADHGQWIGRLKALWRKGGVDAVGRLLEPAREQAVLLRDSIGKWTLRGAEPDFGKDHEMQRKVSWARQRTNGALMQADFTSKQLRGQ